MKIAIITEGDSEFAALPVLYEQFESLTGNVFMKVMQVHVQPDGPAEKIGRSCKTLFAICAQKGVDRVIVLLDREKRSESPAVMASAVERALLAHCIRAFEVFVVIKDRAFENWLIADLKALEAQPKRFVLTDGMKRQVSPGKADRVDALAFLKKAVVGSQYEKIPDSTRTMSKADVRRAAANSRSFRHFLHVIGDPAYAGQASA